MSLLSAAGGKSRRASRAGDAASRADSKSAFRAKNRRSKPRAESASLCAAARSIPIRLLSPSTPIFCAISIARACAIFAPRPNSILARLVLVDNPPHRPAGDFVLRADGGVATLSTATTAAAAAAKGARALTFSGIGVYRPRLFADIADGQTIGLAAVLQKAIANGAVAGEYHRGLWADIGAPSRLAAARARFVNLRPLARARAKIRATD